VDVTSTRDPEASLGRPHGHRFLVLVLIGVVAVTLLIVLTSL